MIIERTKDRKVRVQGIGGEDGRKGVDGSF